MAPIPQVVILLFSFLFLFFDKAFNITAILEPFPEFATFSNYLNQTKLVREINRRQTIIVLVVDNSRMSAISSLSEESLKHLMEVHVILDYYDIRKISRVPHESFVVTTLFQTIGIAANRMGFLNVIHKVGKLVVFGSAVRGAPHSSTLIKKVVTMPYNISVLQVSEPINTPGIDGVAVVTPASAPLEETNLLIEAPKVAYAPIESPEEKIGDAPIDAPRESIDAPADSPKEDELASDVSEETNISHKKAFDASSSTSSRGRLSIGAILGLIMATQFL